MISNENKIFLKESFDIDCDEYTEEQINELLDEIILHLDKNILEKKLKNLKLLKELDNIISESHDE